MTYIVALSGGIASGKSTIASLFAKLGVPVIDADTIAHQVVQKDTPALEMIRQHFSQEILLANGELDRAQLREIIFNNEHERLWLNNLLHPLIAAETQRQIANQSAPYVLWVVPLLIENHLQQYAQRIIIIDTEPEIQLERLIIRDNIDEDLARNMLLSQTSNQTRLSYADDIIKNNNKIAELELQIIALHEKYLILSKDK